LFIRLPWASTLALSLACPSFRSPTSAARPEMAVLVKRPFKWSIANSIEPMATLNVAAAAPVKNPPAWILGIRTRLIHLTPSSRQPRTKEEPPVSANSATVFSGSILSFFSTPGI